MHNGSSQQRPHQRVAMPAHTAQTGHTPVPANTATTAPAPAALTPAAPTPAAPARTARRAPARKSYKRAQRERNSHSAAVQFAQLAGIIRTLFTHRLVIGLVIVAIVIVGILVPFREFYVAQREGEVLQQKYELIQQKNDELAAQRDKLLTQEGIEDEARLRGYVSPGEVGVTVEGEEQPNDPARDMKLEYEDKRDWLQTMLDTLFAYDPLTTWNKQ